MKTLKSMLSLILVIAMLLTSVAVFADETAPATTTETTTEATQEPVSNIVREFPDVTKTEKYYDAVQILNKLDIIKGYEDGTFGPMKNVTRAEFVKMLVLATGIEPAEDYSGYFADVKKDDWFAPFVEAAKTAGIATGADGKFMPDENISREDMAVLLYRAYGFEASENERDVFIDSNLISDYAKSAVFALYEKGIILGNGNGEFNPKGNALRAEAAQIIYRSI